MNNPKLDHEGRPRSLDDAGTIPQRIVPGAAKRHYTWMGQARSFKDYFSQFLLGSVHIRKALESESKGLRCSIADACTTRWFLVEAGRCLEISIAWHFRSDGEWVRCRVADIVLVVTSSVCSW